MRGAGTTTAVIVGVLVLTGCGGENTASGREAGGERATAVAADPATRTVEELREDIRAAVAAGNLKPLRFVADEELISACEVGAVVRSGAPEKRAVADVVAALKVRGWRERRHSLSAANDAWQFLKEDKWVLTLVAGRVSEKVVSFGPAADQPGRAEPFQGMVLRGLGPCGDLSASVSSSG